jgi:hypothetical protein
VWGGGRREPPHPPSPNPQFLKIQFAMKSINYNIKLNIYL